MGQASQNGLSAVRLILASGSPRRRDLLAVMGLACRVRPAEVDEWEAGDADPAALVLHNARLKADAVSAMFPNAPTLAADTTVALGDAVLNKPVDLEDARRMLRQLSGRTHTVHTGVSLRWPARGSSVDFVESSQVRFRVLDDATISAYFGIVNPLDKAGAYGIQEGRDMIIEDWQGSLHNIMGLPTERLHEVFEQQEWWSVLEKRA